MAKSFLTPINLNGLELLNARLQQLATAPGSPYVGLMYYDTALGYARIYSASGWVNLVPGGTDVEAVQDAIGAAFAAGTASGITVTYDDTNNAFNFSVAADGAAATPTLRTLGTAATQAAAGNDSRLSDARNPIAGSVTNSSVATGAAISSDKLADGTTNGVYTLAERSKLAGITSDAVAGTASLRTLGTGAQQAVAGNDSRLSDTRTPTAGTVTNSSVAANAAISADKLADGSTNGVYTLAERTKLAGIASGATNYSDTNARANRLDQFAAPTASVAFNSQRITGLADPVSAQDAATKNYVDGVATGLDVKGSVRVATTANITLSGLQTIDGVSVVAGDRVLVKNQTTASANGIYVVASGAWTRSTDADASAEVTGGMFVFVTEGSTYADTGWVLATNDTITLGTTSLSFVQFSGAGTYLNGNGLSLTGSTFAVVAASGGGLTVSGSGVAIDTTVVVRKYAATIGDGTTTSIVVTHNLGTTDVQVRVFRVASPFDEVEPDVQHTSTNTVTIIFAVAPTSGQYRAVVQG
jgi:hypothetical protein